MRNARLVLVSVVVVLSFVGAQFWLAKVQGGQRQHLLLAHNLAPEHPVHLGMELFAKRLLETTQGRITVTIYPNGQLGSEKQVLELVQQGAISMTKVSSLSLESFSPRIGILNLPFLFRDREHDFRVLDSWVGEELLAAPVTQNLRGLTYYDAGDRSFYANRPINRPADVAGLKIRVMENATAIKMLQLLGGSPTPMPYGEVYTALQQGVIDGAENNLTALTVNRHGEVSKFYSLVRHIFAPDILIISETVWKGLSETDAKLVREAAQESKLFQRKLWQEKLEGYRKEAEEKLQVKFITPDRAPFVELVQPLHREFEARGPEYLRLLTTIREM
jgi:tripartite ATP-independent transporter DctP family solute receptor